MCRNCADCLIGSTGADRSNPAWLQTYRALEHGNAKDKCKNGKISLFPKDVEDFAVTFIEAQVLRHNADYNPMARFAREEALTLVLRVEEAIVAFQKVGIKDRRAFAAWVIFRQSKR